MLTIQSLFSFLIWLGDLNYRIDGLKLEDVKNLIENADYKLLKENDQVFLNSIALYNYLQMTVGFLFTCKWQFRFTNIAGNQNLPELLHCYRMKTFQLQAFKIIGGSPTFL